MDEYFDIVVIGAGAAGLTAAISASRMLRKNNFKCTVALIEKSKTFGKKILVTGNGKCNITNMNISKDFYYGKNMAGIRSILKSFGYNEAAGFFDSLGIVLKSDKEKRVYPMSLQAVSVRDAMVEEAERLNIYKFAEVYANYIKSLKNGMFEIESEDMVIRCKKLIICTGGKSAPFSGYDGDGYNYLSYFGHCVSKVYPALVPIKSKDAMLRDLKGVRWVCKVNLLADGKVIKSSVGEVQFNENNLSGICVFQLSRLASEFIDTSKVFGKKYKNMKVSLDLFPDYSLKDLEILLLERARKLSFISIENFMAGIINKKLGYGVLKKLKLSKSLKYAGQLKSSDIEAISRLMKNLEFSVDGTMDWKQSQVTAGGARLDDFEIDTMESKKKKGLYCAGEILDADGICGGYNLHWAWATGYISGCAAAKSLITESIKNEVAKRNAKNL